MKILFLLIMSFSFAAHAASFDLSPGEFKVDVPKGWESVKNLYGMKLMFAGPMKGENRPVITVESTKLPYTFDVESLKADQGTYRMGRLNWLRKYSGTPLGFTPYKTQPIKGNLTAHIVGFEYEMGAKRFVESSYYIPCRGVLFFFKSLIPKDEEKEVAPKVDEMFKTFECVRGNQ